uniref:Probable ATP-dependent transporter ycf16 n=1 Tax=Gastroclonium compressum TaxID=1852973 RepID=A0A173G014_GASCM|nr:sulfate ABC transporter protein [Coeloseira compressa]ANH09607.1 sulfate ABC transporter protein [Coeloseira compressa]
MIQNRLLEIKNLHACINNTAIINGLNLLINKGEIHAIMGKNGSGKSTLAKVIAGHPSYKITKGQILLNSEHITYEDPEERSHKGIFLGFQYPVEIPGVSNIDFLRVAYNAKRTSQNLPILDPLSFFEFINQKSQLIDLDSSFLQRSVNTGFSGGEKKKNEILQMALLDTQLSILDEIDSGLDIDALKTIANNINKLQDQNKAIIIITHYQRILEYIKPNFIHIMQKGKITYTGNFELAQKLEDYGYNYIDTINNS